ncbi:hypothetical protein PSV08DRAFT_252660 [Bipolaris maydis]|uniref:uncharacterized protein n=1 Tax=Cochliobolus heterostrophus TaxID=5016 RepID=UPI0024D06993|nr:hypothetical protein J3E73DRAFT_256034 [Bipolaris maydis]KAJ5062897.1 hypothetical protein J3E74DRAFT_288571 [Bipolaris maydis]KAJ6265614.1 hypothetical protein PSV08DRAFT_252660 [Bipolaris maydis]KAJ6283429.1 hypothetical protein J3E71DRAFT_239548 [Bipolaris maydis]
MDIRYNQADHVSLPAQATDTMQTRQKVDMNIGRGTGHDTRAFAAALPSEGETDQQDDGVPFLHIAQGQGPFFREFRTIWNTGPGRWCNEASHSKGEGEDEDEGKGKGKAEVAGSSSRQYDGAMADDSRRDMGRGAAKWPYFPYEEAPARGNSGPKGESIMGQVSNEWAFPMATGPQAKNGAEAGAGGGVSTIDCTPAEA